MHFIFTFDQPEVGILVPEVGFLEVGILGGAYDYKKPYSALGSQCLTCSEHRMCSLAVHSASRKRMKIQFPTLVLVLVPSHFCSTISEFHSQNLCGHASVVR